MISGYSHSFDVGVATELGLNCATVFNHIIYWLKINASKNYNFIDGKTWMYETQQQIADFLGYLTVDEVKKSIVKLLESGILIKGNHNKNPFDKTSWYTVADQNIIQIKKTLTKAPYGSISSAVPLCPDRPTAPCIYNEQEEHIHKEQQQQAVAAAVFNLEKINKIHDCLTDIEIPMNQKIEISKKYTEETVKNAVDWSTNPNNIPTKSLTASLKYACKNELSKTEFEQKTKTPYEKINNYFKNGEIYNGAECFLTDKSIAFSRGMKHGQLKLDKFFSYIKLKELCESFGINYKL